MVDTLKELISFAADFLTVIASSIAIFLYFTQRDKIASAIKTLLNYSFSLSVNELRYKLERLNDYNVNEKEHLPTVLNLLNEIHGQLRGNRTLILKFEDIIIKIEEYTNTPKALSEPKKRSLVSELREGLRSIDVNNYGKILK